MKPPAKKPAAWKAELKKAAPKKVASKKVQPKKAEPKKPAPPAATPPAAPPAATSAATSAIDASVLDRLHAVIVQRRGADPAHSHSARLLSRGMAKVAQKFGEESVECVIEAVGGNRAALVAESADVLYHLLVVWVAASVSPEAVWAELTRREGVSGVMEKLSRSGPLGTTKIP